VVRSSLPRRPELGDIIAGLSVALVLIPQSLAYAEIAGVPPAVGLCAAALPPLLAAPFASSPYLQTGPVALTSLLTFGALSSLEATGTADYVELAALLALVVGVFRLALGLMRLGSIAYLMSQPVLVGFTSAAAVLIVASQLPSVFGADPPDDGVLESAWWVLRRPGEWDTTAVVLGLATLITVVGLRRVHRLIPGVLVVVVAATVWSEATDYDGATIGDLPGGFMTLSLDLPFGDLGSLLIPGLVIALVGFAEPASIARTYAAADRSRWSANRELISQGVANLASGVGGGFPVGGSFGRSSLNHIAGARTVWSGAITGAIVLVTMPLTPALEALPRAVLGAVILSAVYTLFAPRAMARVFRESRVQGIVTAGTFAATLATSPNVEYGVLIGLGLSIAAHLYRELRVDHASEVDGTTLILRPAGVVWFATTPQLERSFLEALAANPEVERLRIDFSNVGRFDYSGSATLATLIENACASGIEAEITCIPPHASRALAAHLGGRYGVPTLDELPRRERHQLWANRDQPDC